MPFGDSDNSIGGVLSVGSSQLQPTVPPSSTKFGEQGAVGLAFSRWLFPSTISTAGAANLIPWGTGSRALGKSYYGAVTQYMGLPFNHQVYPLSASVGVGTGAYNPFSAINHAGMLESLSDRYATFFVNTSLNLTPDLTVVGDYYSETFAVGVAYNNHYLLPLNLMLFAANLKTSPLATSSYFGLRIALGVPFALFNSPQKR